MKFIVSIILTALLSFAIGFYLDWWSVALAAFVVAALIHQRPWKSLLSGFLGVFLLWGGLALWIDIKNQHLLSGQVAELFSLGNAAYLLILITAFIGALVGGFAALTGSFIKAR